jgi:hypothetical protein
MGVRPAQRLLEHGQGTVNLVAAIPSLHAAYALLVAAFLWPRTHVAILRAVLASYPLAMAFSLVYAGEHYVVDVIVGWACVSLVMVAGAVLTRRGRLVRRPLGSNEASVPSAGTSTTSCWPLARAPSTAPSVGTSPDVTRRSGTAGSGR